MVAPLTQKANRLRQEFSTVSPFRETKYYLGTKWVQKSPYTVVLPLDTYVGTQVTNDSPNTYGGPIVPNASAMNNYQQSNALFNDLITKSYENLKGKLYDSASLGTDFAEYHQSYAMITKTAGTLLTAARQVRKLDFLGAARTFRMKFIPSGVSVRKSFANNWLEFWFGWKPLVSDIYDAVEVVSNPIKAVANVSGGSTYTFTSRSLSVIPNNDRTFLQFTCSYSMRQGARIKAITDRNLHLLDQLGLINPVSVAWEIVPFSFVVDWFANVGSVLGSFSDFAGMQLENSWNTQSYSVAAFKTQEWIGPPANVSPRWAYGTGKNVHRKSGLSGPALSLKRLKLPSSTRSLTAISLLTQQLSR